MIKPTLEQARPLCKNNKIIPISLELYSDSKTPIEVLRILKSKNQCCFLLESVEGGEKWGRYSFLGFNPSLTISLNDGNIIIKTSKQQTKSKGDPTSILREVLAQHKTSRLDFLPPFTGGLVGYISYDFIKYTQPKLKLINNNENGFNDLYLMLFDKVIAFDHLKQKLFIIVNIKTENLEENYINAVMELKNIETMLKTNNTVEKYQSNLLSNFQPLFTKEKYCNMVDKTKQHIKQGDILQAVISNRLSADFKGDLLPTYRALRTINPSPYMFYMDFSDTQIAGASPETLIKLNNKKLSTFPIAGTCKRGETKQQDELLINQLLADEKELSEHDMLVDLGKNDIGKISEFGTVMVEEYQKVLRFSHVSHICSTVTGIIKQGYDQLDAISAVLPAGTLSGAPKVKACEIINEQEQHKRGAYGGAVGYIDFAGNMDMCIGIRMAVLKGEKVFVQSGAGIVLDSNPEKEYQECLNKANAMIKAINLSQEIE